MKRYAIICIAFILMTVGCGASHSASSGIARPHDNGFEVIDVQLKQDALGFMSGTAQVRNSGRHTHTADMRFKFRQDGKQVATATALAHVVPVGQTVTVDLSSFDKWNGRPATYTFQVAHLF